MTIEHPYTESRRRFLKTSVALGSAIAFGPKILGEAFAASSDKPQSGVVDRGERSGFSFNKDETAIVIIDPQNEVLSEKGLAWGAVGESVKENHTVENMERFKPYIDDGKTVVVSPHRVFGPQTNDLTLQLRKRGISKVILGGMLANMCVESHLRHLLEEGFEVAVAKDATAAPRHPEWGYGYTAALINFKFLAHAVLSTDEVVKAIDEAGAAHK